MVIFITKRQKSIIRLLLLWMFFCFFFFIPWLLLFGQPGTLCRCSSFLPDSPTVLFLEKLRGFQPDRWNVLCLAARCFSVSSRNSSRKSETLIGGHPSVTPSKEFFGGGRGVTITWTPKDLARTNWASGLIRQ